MTDTASAPGVPAEFVCELPDRGLLRIEGEDAASFLHGQFTCDVNGLSPAHSRYGGYCTPKGRLLATFLLIRDPAGFYMQAPYALCESLRKRLSMYVLRARVKITDVSGNIRTYGARGPASANSLGLSPLPTAAHEAVVSGSTIAVRLPVDRLLIITDAGTNLSGATADPALWTALDIEAGIANIQPETQEQFVPQMANLDLIGGVSFNKGCYPGQEIVARMHYLGKLKERMYRISFPAGLPPSPNTPLYAPNFGAQAAGAIVQAVRAASGLVDALAVLQTSSVQGGEVHVGTPDGPRATVLTHPQTA